MSSLLESLLESDAAVANNLDLNYTVNQYAELVSESERYLGDTTFTARRIIFEQYEGRFVCMLEDVEHLCAAQKCDASDAVEQMAKSITDCGGPEEIGASNLAVVVTQDDVDDLMEACKSNKTTMAAKKGQIKKRTDLISKLKEKGVKIYKK